VLVLDRRRLDGSGSRDYDRRRHSRSSLSARAPVVFHMAGMVRSGMMFRRMMLRGMMFRGMMICGMLFRSGMMFHLMMPFRRRVFCRGRMVLRVGTVLGGERLFPGETLFAGGAFFRSEVLRVPVVRGPKTFGKTIFHANSLSESPDAHASPTQVIRPRNALNCRAGGAAGRIGSFRTIGKVARVRAQMLLGKGPEPAVARFRLPTSPKFAVVRRRYVDPGLRGGA
jgi:hypothetical protein